MKIKSITGQRFRSFLKPFEFEIPATGLWYLTGTNEINKDLGANGVGKSTLFESVHWCLFGKLSNNLKASDVANWVQPKGCAVTLDLGNKKELTRTWGPNSLKLNGIEVDQIELEKELRVSPATFTHSHFFPQAKDSFLDLKPEAKLTLLVDILKLHVWEAASTQALVDSTMLDDSASKLEGRISEVKTILKQSTGEEELKKQSAEWEREHKAKTVNIEREIKRAESNVGSCKAAREA